MPRSGLPFERMLDSVGPAVTGQLHGSFAHFRAAAGFIARHTGIPAVLVAAVLIVLSWRLMKRMAHVAVEVAVVAVLLVALTKLGVVSW